MFLFLYAAPTVQMSQHKHTQITIKHTHSHCGYKHKPSYIHLFRQSSVYMMVPHGASKPLPPAAASLRRDYVTRLRKLLGCWRIRDDGDDGPLLERDAVKLASARIWLMFIWSRRVCCSVIARASDESSASNFASLLSLVSPPAVVVPRCVLTEASVLGSALHLITTKTVAESRASSAS